MKKQYYKGTYMRKRSRNLRKHKHAKYFNRKSIETFSDDVLTLRQVSQKFQLDPRTIRGVAFELGGKRFGNRWRFRLSVIMECFNNAKFDKEPRKPMACQSSSRRETGSLQSLSSWGEIWRFMAVCEAMGNRATEHSQGTVENILCEIQTFSERLIQTTDFGSQLFASNLDDTNGYTDLCSSSDELEGEYGYNEKEEDPYGLQKAYYLGD